MPFRFGPLEIIIVLAIIFIIFGVGKLPQVSESIGRGLRSLRRGKNGNAGDDSGATISNVKVIKKLEDDEAQAKMVESKEEPKAG